MDRNTVIGIVMMFLFIVGYSYFTRPSEEELALLEQQNIARQDSLQKAAELAQTETKLINSLDDTLSAGVVADPVRDSIRMAILAEEQASRYGAFAAASSGEGKEIALENDKVKVLINTKGGLFSEAIIKDYTKYNSTDPIALWNKDLSEMNLWLNYPAKGAVNAKDLVFDVIRQEDTPNGKTAVLRLKTNSPENYIDLVYTLAPDAYEVKLSMQFIGMDRLLDMNKDNFIQWNAVGLHNEKGIEWERQHSSIFFREQGQGRDYLSEAREDDDILDAPLNWMAFKQNYFSAIVINDANFGSNAILRSYPPENSEDTTVTMFYEAKLPLALSPSANSTSELRYYFGPNDMEPLKAMEVEELDRIIDYGWWIFGWVNRVLVRPVFNWLSGFIGSAGIVILVLTLIIKLLLFPITWKNFLSSAKMRVLKPEIDEINEKHKDQMEKQQAQMALYKQTGVNPFAGCLPTLLQMPILYAMFRFFPAHISLRGESFLWADDLGAFDSILQLPFTIPFYGDHVSGFTLLMATSTFFYTRMNSTNMPTSTQPGMPNMKLIMNIFPFMMLFFFNKYAAGLSLYYFVANFISIFQMVVIKRYFVSEEKIRAKIDANKAKPKKKKSAFQQKLEEMQKLQQQNTKKGKK
jgi:YidC/Oxa1 family membrane protein insertase